MKIVAISDTHNLHRELTIPECDVLIHAGDATMLGTAKEMEDFANWFMDQPAKQKFFIPGNHEVGFYHDRIWELGAYTPKDLPYVRTVIDNRYKILETELSLYGSPWTYVSPKWGFQFPWYELNGSCEWYEHRETQRKTWEAIPEDVEILVTHGPPYGILDAVPTNLWGCSGPGEKYIQNCGDEILMDEIKKRKKLKYHFFGHIHESYGKKKHKGVNYYNVAICDRSYKAVNPITIVDIK